MRSKSTHKELEQRIHALEKELADYKSSNNSTRLHQQYLEAILNNTNLPIYLKDANYNYILINHQYERLAHITTDQIQGKNDFAIFPEPVAQLFRSQDEEVVKCRTLIEFEETVPLPDGVHTFLTAKFPLIDSEGAVYAVGGVCTDITASKKTEAKLKEAEEKYREIFEASPIGMTVYDSTGQCIEANRAICKIIGSTRELVLAQNYNHIESWKKSGLFEAAVEAIRKNKRTTKKVTLTSTFGKKLTANANFSPIHIDGKMHLLFTFDDLAKVKKMEDEREKLLVEIQEAHDDLEQRVADRTAQLDRRTESLMETNVALKILLEKREEDKKQLEEKVMFNVEKLISPYVEKFKMRCNEPSQEALLDILQSNLDEITSSFAHNHKDFLSNLTPAQIQVANMIKQGQTTKEIACLLNLSPSTIACHRQEIRKRLALTNKKINLQAALLAN